MADLEAENERLRGYLRTIGTATTHDDTAEFVLQQIKQLAGDALGGTPMLRMDDIFEQENVTALLETLDRITAIARKSNEWKVDIEACPNGFNAERLERIAEIAEAASKEWYEDHPDEEDDEDD